MAEDEGREHDGGSGAAGGAAAGAVAAEGLPPVELAAALLALPGAEERRRLVQSLPPGRAAETLEHLRPEEQYRLLDHLPEESARAVLNEMSSDVVADLLLALHPRQRDRLLHWLPSDYREKVASLMAYPENSAGSLATVDYIGLREYWTAEQALAHVRKVGREADVVYYLYVLDALGRLVGVASLRDLILAEPGMPVGRLMKTRVIQVEAGTDQEEVARVLRRYDLVAVPVVDAAGRMLGVVTVDEVLDVMEEEATEDVHRMGAVQPVAEPYLEAPLWTLFRKRVGWLLALFVAEALTGTVLRHYEDEIARVVALALFIPLVIGTGGNAGSQASTLVIRALAVGDVGARDVLRVVWKESRLGLVLGAVMGSIGILRALLLGVTGDIALAVGAAQVVVVIWASLVGALLPLLGSRFRLDPAVFSAPLIATATDAVGLLIYFEVARLLLGL